MFHGCVSLKSVILNWGTLYFLYKNSNEIICKTKKVLTLYESSLPAIKKISLKEKYVIIALDDQF